MVTDIPLSATGRYAERAAALLSGTLTPVPALPAATVMVLRPDPAGGAGVEVFLQRRVASMAFAPSMMVFPGGRVCDADTEPVPWAGPPASVWGRLMGLPAVQASAVLNAAVREVAEECGLVLAVPAAEARLAAGDRSGRARWREHRDGLEAGSISLAQVLSREALVLDSARLHLHAHWVTPAFEPRRYDTWFFTAALPPGQHADDSTTEADLAGWFRPGEVLAAAEAATVRLMPPTRACLVDLVDVRHPDEVLDRPLAPVPRIEPRVLQDGDRMIMRIDTDPRTDADIDIDADGDQW